MEYSINLKDLLNIARRKIKTVIVFAVFFALLAGAYVVIKDKRNEVSREELSDIQAQSEVYNKYNEEMPKVKEDLQKKLVKAYDNINTNPVMENDPKKQQYAVITFLLDDNVESRRSAALESWIDSADCRELFGTDNKSVEEFRIDLVHVSDSNDDIEVTVLKSKYYDYKKVTDRVKKIIEKKASKANVGIKSVETVYYKRFDQRIFDRQDVINNNAARLTDQLTRLQNYKMEQPESVGSGGGAKALIKKMLIVIAGLIFGACIGVAVVSFNVIRKGIILSDGQVEDFFGIERILNCNLSDDKYPVIVDAVVNAIDETDDDVMMVSVDDNQDYRKLIGKVDDHSDRKYHYSEITEDDVEVLKELNNIGGIIIPVEVGITPQRDIHETIRWAQKFKKNVLGYLVVER